MKRDKTATLALVVSVCTFLVVAAGVAFLLLGGGKQFGVDPLWNLKTHDQKKDAYKQKIDAEMKAFGEAFEESFFGPPEKHVEWLEARIADAEQVREDAIKNGNEKIAAEMADNIKTFKVDIVRLKQKLKK